MSTLVKSTHTQMGVINCENDNCFQKRLLSVLLSENSLRVVTCILQYHKFLVVRD